MTTPRKRSQDANDNRPPRLIVEREQAERQILDRIQRGLELQQLEITSPVLLDYARNNYYTWDEYNLDMLRQMFDTDKVSREYQTKIPAVGGLSFLAQVRKVHSDMQRKVRILQSVRERLELYSVVGQHIAVQNRADDQALPPTGGSVFIVHGRDEASKQSVARFIEKLDLEAVILHEQPNAGKTIIEKLERERTSDYAVVLLTPDDMGKLRQDAKAELKPRARQNVIFELGFFVGRLGRERVSVLHKAEVETPTDYDGVVWIPMDEAEGWQLKLAKELKQVGFSIDLDKLLR